jgi:hypothetical protein
MLPAGWGERSFHLLLWGWVGSEGLLYLTGFPAGWRTGRGTAHG